MKMLYIPSLALILGYAFAAPSSLVPREPSNEPINVSVHVTIPKSLETY